MDAGRSREAGRIAAAPPGKLCRFSTPTNLCRDTIGVCSREVLVTPGGPVQNIVPTLEPATASY